MTVTSIAACWPWDKEGKMSAEREEEPRTNEGTSQQGKSAAEWAAVKLMPLRELCLAILSCPPLPTSA